MTTFMRATAPLLAGLLIGGGAHAQQADLGPLVSPEELKPVLDQVEVLDIRLGDESGYGGGHIEGAVNAPYALFRGPEENPGKVPGVEALSDALGKIGVEPSERVVIAYQGEDVSDFGGAARVYWTLKSSGYQNLSILNGGLNAWTEAGYETSTEAVEPEPVDLALDWTDRWTATAEEVQKVVDGGEEALLLDARPESFWNGEESHPASAKPGTIPQSEYFEHAGWFSDGPAIVDADAARTLAEKQGFTGNAEIISFCNTGHWAATNWFALSELAGIDNVKLYPESVVGWSNAGYVMANVPGPVKTLWFQIKSAF